MGNTIKKLIHYVISHSHKKGFDKFMICDKKSGGGGTNRSKHLTENSLNLLQINKLCLIHHLLQKKAWMMLLTVFCILGISFPVFAYYTVDLSRNVTGNSLYISSSDSKLTDKNIRCTWLAGTINWYVNENGGTLSLNIGPYYGTSGYAVVFTDNHKYLYHQSCSGSRASGYNTGWYSSSLCSPTSFKTLYLCYTNNSSFGSDVNRYYKGVNGYTTERLWSECQLRITVNIRINPATCSHNWSGWNTSGDNHYRYCTKCGTWVTSHNRWSSWKWITNASQHYRYCNNCGQTWDWGGHSFGGYYGNTATCTSGGVQYRSCSSCGYVETSGTGVLGHSWPSDYSQDGGYLYKNCTRCGTRLETKGISYTVAFDGNGGLGTMSSMNFIYGAAQNLTKNTFARENYDFLGWSINKDDTSPTYIDEQAVTNLTTNHGSTVTLYAIWKLSTTTITFHAEGGTGGPGEQTWLIGSRQYPTSPIREGYHFAGWNTTEDGTGDMWPTDNIVIAGISDYYAQWEPNTYTAVQESNHVQIK